MEGPLLKLFRLFTGSGDPFDVVVSFFAVFVILLLVFPIHECAHGLMAKFLGDDTAERQGRLTLNPMTHIDPIGALFMMFFPIGWAKPVEVNCSRCHKVKGRTAMALTAAAGPFANILMAYIVMIIYKIIVYTTASDAATANFEYVYTAFVYIIIISLYLAVLNLFPIPPFDGSKILFAFLKPRTVIAIISHQQIISLVFLLLLFTTGILTSLIGGISNGIFSVLDFLSGYVDMFFK